MTEPMPMPPPAEPQSQPAKTKSKGEKLFDRLVYGGIAGVGTFMLTLYMSNKFKNGSWAGPRYSGIVDGAENFLKRYFPNKASRSMAEESVQTTSLMMGGNAMLLPVGLAEHHKTKIVSGLNVMLGDETPPEQIEQAPKQTWLSLVQGRLLAWGAVFGTLISARIWLPQTFKTYCNEFAEQTHKLVQSIKQKPIVAEETARKATTSYRVGEIAALDIFATIAAVTLLYIGGHFFARKHEEKLEKKEAKAEGARNAADEVMTSEAVVNAPQTKVGGEKAVEGKVMAPVPAHQQVVAQV